MTKDESIDLAVKLHKDYEEIEKLLNKISENENQIMRLAGTYPKHYSAFSYFMPYLLASLITLLLSLIPAGFVISIAIFLDKSNRNDTYSYMPYAVALTIAAIFALIHLIGGFVARNKSRYMNNLEQERFRGEQRKRERLLYENEDLKVLLYKQESNLNEFNEIVPTELRNSGKMNAVKRLLLSGKADNFNDAVTLLSSKSDQVFSR